VRLVSADSLTLLVFADPPTPVSFLDDMERIAVKDYQATDDDIVRARLKRSGVMEYRMVFENGKSFVLKPSWFQLTGGFIHRQVRGH
jgi:hypothetical protein